MKKRRVLLLVVAILATVAVWFILNQAPTTTGDLHYYHQDLTQEDADRGLGFDYGPSDMHLTKTGWLESFETRLSEDTSLLADWYYLIVKDENIKKSAKKGNELEADLAKDSELRQKIYTKVKDKLDGATIEKTKFEPGTRYLTGIMKPEAPTEAVPVLDSKNILTETDLTVMAIYANPSKTGDGKVTAYCIPACGDQPAELKSDNVVTTTKTSWTGDPKPTKGGKGDPSPDKGKKKGHGCRDKQTWEPPYGQQAEKYTDDPAGGGNGHMNTEDPAVPGTTRIDEDPRIKDGWTTKPDVPKGTPEVGAGTGKVSGDD